MYWVAPFYTTGPDWQFLSYDAPKWQFASYDPPNGKFASYDPPNWLFATVIMGFELQQIHSCETVGKGVCVTRMSAGRNNSAFTIIQCH